MDVKNESKNKPIHLGGTPQFGYTNKDKLLVIDKEESKWVKWMFNSYVKGMESIKMTLTLKESDELTEKILLDIRRKLDIDTQQVINEIRDQLEKTYKPEKN